MINMKLIMENWNSYMKEASVLSEEDLQQVEQVYQELLQSTMNEGIMDVGSRLWNATKRRIGQLKDWGEDKLNALVKKMGTGLVNFFQKLRQKGVWKKYKTRREVNAVKLLMTKKHIPLATMIFTAIIKLTGGLALDAVLKSKEIINSLTEVLGLVSGGKIKEAVTALFGSADALEALQIVKKFLDFSKDTKSMAAQTGTWDAFGGMAENN